MSAMTTRDALAKGLARHRLHPSMNICKGCDWRATPGAGSLADQHEAHRADALLASGAVVDATLADDDALVYDVAVAADGWPEKITTREATDLTRKILRALATALTDREQAAWAPDRHTDEAVDQ